MPPKRYNLRKQKSPVVWVDDDTLKTKNDDTEPEEDSEFEPTEEEPESEDEDGDSKISERNDD